MANVIGTGIWVIVLLVFLAGIAIGVALVVSAVRRRRAWSGPSMTAEEIKALGGELQEPQFADRGSAGSSGAGEAADAAIAIIGTDATPFSNRAPLSVQRSPRSPGRG